MNKFVIMGVQGCGKGTQAKLLAQDLDLVHISVGDIFRWNIQQHTKLAARIKRIVAEGRLVPDDIVADVVHTRLDGGRPNWNYGFILDGFPRNRTQAEFFLERFDIDAVIDIQVPDHVVLERVMSRRLCSGCGLDYNLIHHRPAVADRCDVCGGSLVARPGRTPRPPCGPGWPTSTPSPGRCWTCSPARNWSCGWTARCRSPRCRPKSGASWGCPSTSRPEPGPGTDFKSRPLRPT